MTSRSVWDDVVDLKKSVTTLGSVWRCRKLARGLSSRSHGNAIIDRIHYQARRGVAAIGELSLDSVTTELRVERMILECRALGIEPDARTIAEIMVDDDVTVGRYEDFSDEWTVAFETYERAAERALASKRISRRKA